MSLGGFEELFRFGRRSLQVVLRCSVHLDWRLARAPTPRGRFPKRRSLLNLVSLQKLRFVMFEYTRLVGLLRRMLRILSLQRRQRGRKDTNRFPSGLLWRHQLLHRMPSIRQINHMRGELFLVDTDRHRLFQRVHGSRLGCYGLHRETAALGRLVMFGLDEVVGGMFYFEWISFWV